MRDISLDNHISALLTLAERKIEGVWRKLFAKDIRIGGDDGTRNRHGLRLSIRRWHVLR